jgi:hypothetical protein
MLRHPFAALPPGRARRIALAALAAALVGVSAWMKPSSDALAGEGTELAIVSLEFAATPARAARILGLWQERGALGAAITNVRLDYLFLIAYSTFLSLAAAMASDVLHHRPRLARLGVLLAWGALAAGLLDAIENVGLLVMLGDPGHVGGAASWVAAACAAPKFALVILALIYALAGAIVFLIAHINRPQIER